MADKTPARVAASSKLLIETMAVRPQIVESADGGKKLRAKGLFARAGIATENGRVYPMQIMDREIGKLQESIGRRRVAGELDHPGDGKTQLKRVSHLITGLELQPNGDVIGEFEVLDTPEGLTLRALVQAGMEVGVSSRGFGSVVQNGKGEQVVQDDFTLHAFDVVAMPATEGAYPEFFTESVELPGGKKMNLSDMTPDVLREKAPELFAAIEKSATESLRQEMLDMVAKTREEVREQVRAELRTDPKFASAVLAVEELKKIVAPMMVPEEVRVSAEQRDADLEKVQAENRDLRAGIVQAHGIAKELGFSLILEKELKEDENRGLVMMLLGNLTQYEDEAAFRSKLAQVREEIVKATKKDTALKEEVEKVEQGVRALQEEVSNSKKALSEATEIAHQLGMRLLVSEASDNPNRYRVLQMIEKGQIRSLEEARDALKAAAPSRSAIGDLAERLRKGREAVGEALGEDRPEPVRKKPVPAGNGVPGVPLTEDSVGSSVMDQLNEMVRRG